MVLGHGEAFGIRIRIVSIAGMVLERENLARAGSWLVIALLPVYIMARAGESILNIPLERETKSVSSFWDAECCLWMATRSIIVLSGNIEM